MRVKAACTSWKHVLSQANGAPSHLEVHSKRVYRYVDLFSELSPSAKQQVLDSYFKFMFVRHPLERLVSAHRDKFIDTTCVLLTFILILECGPMPNVMAALPNIGGTLCSTPQSFADAHY